jgi:hypothetical protein
MFDERRAVNFEFNTEQAEVMIVVHGPDAAMVVAALFGAPLEPNRLLYRHWAPDAPPAAVCWMPPNRVEVRVSDSPPWPARLRDRLLELRAPTPTAFQAALATALRRLETWSYADTDQGGGAEELAEQLAALLRQAPTARARREVLAARDALDDGLPADAIAAPLYRARQAASGSD